MILRGTCGLWTLTKYIPGLHKLHSYLDTYKELQISKPLWKEIASFVLVLKTVFAHPYLQIQIQILFFILHHYISCKFQNCFRHPAQNSEASTNCKKYGNQVPICIKSAVSCFKIYSMHLYYCWKTFFCCLKGWKMLNHSRGKF